MGWVHLGVALLFLALSVVFRLGKGAALIAGYNTASEEEKMKTDEKKLCRFMSQLMLALAACMLASAAGGFFQSRGLIWTGMALTAAVVVGGVICANTGHRFEKDR